MKLFLLSILLTFSMMMNAQIHPFFSATNDKYGFKDASGKVIIAPKYDLAYPIDEGMAAVRLNGKYGYVNQNGKEIISPKYDNTWKFIGGYAAVRLGGRYGFIDQNGNEVVPIIYEEANNYHGACCYKGVAHVKRNGKWKILRINSGH